MAQDERQAPQAAGKEQPEGQQSVEDEAHARQSNTAQGSDRPAAKEETEQERDERKGSAHAG